MNNQMTNEKTPAASKKRWRVRQLIGHFLRCKTIEK